MELYKVEIKRTLIILADSEKEAVELAKRYEYEDLYNEPDFIIATKIISEKAISHFENSLPYGEEGKQTCSEIMKNFET